MKNIISVMVLWLLIMVCTFNVATAKEWRFPVGLTFVSGFSDIVDRIEDNMGFVETVDYLPIGLTFQPYLQFDNGFGVGIGFGPMMWITGDADLFNLPVNVNGRYTFKPKGTVSPYVRAGISTHLASGDYVESSKPGFFGAVGVEFLKDKMVSMGVEVGYDTSELEMEDTSFRGGGTEDIQPLAFMINLFAVF